jgi:hypothetical protein
MTVGVMTVGVMTVGVMTVVAVAFHYYFTKY